MKNLPQLVALTAARNEAACIENLIKSVIAQSARPLRWIIIDDGSTDRTVDIVSTYLPCNKWIQIYRLNHEGSRDFAAKARCISEGFRLLSGLEFEIVANLDADISFESDYFAYLREKFLEDPELGIAGTAYVEDDRVSTHHFSDPSHVPGQCQFFLRQCFETIGGYQPVKEGGMDTIAVMMAKAAGWKTRAFNDRTFYHHRRMGSSVGGPMVVAFRAGYRDFLLGNHPAWQLARSLYLTRQRPIAICGFVTWCGYMFAVATRRKKNMAHDLVVLRRREQLQRLSTLLKGFGG